MSLVWIDLEMTGLNISKDVILEIACIITNDELQIISQEPFEAIIHQPLDVLESMSPWCIQTHGASGLTQKCLDSTLSIQQAQESLINYIKKYVPEPKVGILAGNSVHVDRQFLIKEMSLIIEHLHYRIIDVSCVKELTRRWYPKEFENVPVKKLNHRALDDIKESIQELNYYKSRVFK